MVQADVTKPDDIKAMFRKVADEFGELDIFVSNARPEAEAFFQPPMDITLETMDTAFDSQAKAFLISVREATPLMKTGGKILAITYAEEAALRRPPAMGRNGFREGRAGIAFVRYFGVALAKARITRQRDQPRLDRRQRAQTRCHSRSTISLQLARTRLDSDGTPWHSGGCC